ncbi:MAG: EF-P beta-lysylation protein EpmB, partial [Gammaproteobacteria bacterium]
MIPKIEKKCQPAAWQIALKNLIRDPKVLLQRLNLDDTYLVQAQKAGQLFPLRVSESFVARMHKASPQDPLLRQVLPLEDEYHEAQGFTDD